MPTNNEALEDLDPIDFEEREGRQDAASVISDLSPVRVGFEEITHQTRSHIARVLTWATIVIAGTIGAVCAGSIGKIIWFGEIEKVEKLTPLITLLLSQTLVPLTTISITWYFASRHGEARHGSR